MIIWTTEELKSGHILFAFQNNESSAGILVTVNDLIKLRDLIDDVIPRSKSAWKRTPSEWWRWWGFNQ